MANTEGTYSYLLKPNSGGRPEPRTTREPKAGGIHTTKFDHCVSKVSASKGRGAYAICQNALGAAALKAKHRRQRSY